MSIALDQAINYRSKYEISVSNKTLAPKNKSGYSKKHTISRKIVNVFMILSLLVMGFFGISGSENKSAQAFDIPGLDLCKMLSSDGVWYNAPEKAFMGPLNTPTSGKITAYEKYGVSGLNWTVWRGPVDKGAASEAFKKDYSDSNAYWANGDCIPVPEIITAGASNFLFALSKISVFVSGLVYQTAFETVGNAITPMQEQIAQVINPDSGQGGLKDTLYLDFIIPIIMLSALYLGWVGLVKRKSSEALTSAVWMIGSAITGLVLLINPMIIPNASNSVVKNVTEGVMGGITGATTNGLSEVGGTNLCSIDGGGDKTRNIVRLVQCSLWYSFLYVPWSTGQYGYSPSDPAGAELLGQNSDFLGGVSLDAQGKGNDATPKNWPIYQLDQQVYSLDQTSKDEAWSKIPQGMLGEPSNGNGSIENTVWKGDGTTSLISKALFSMIASIGAGLMIFILGMYMIVMEIGLIILMMLAPLFFLIGVHPGFGRRMALKWVETVISLTLKRVVLSVLLAVMITFYSIVIQIPESTLPWFGTVIMIIAISIAGLKYKDTLTDMFNQIDIGGGGAMPIDDTSKASGALKGAALGATVAAGGMLLGARANKASNVIKSGKSAKDSRPKALDEFHSQGAFNGGKGGNGDEGGQPDGGTGGGGPKGTNRSEPNFGGGTEAPETTPINTTQEEEEKASNGNGGPQRPDGPEPINHKADSDNDEKKETNGNGGGPKRPEGAEALNGSPAMTKQERVLKRAEAKRNSIDERLNKRVSKSTRTARVAGGMKTMTRAAASGAMLGYRGSDPGFIAMSANQSIQNSRAGQKAKTNDQVAAARKRQAEYNKAWKEFNSAQDEKAKADATERMNEVYKGMSYKEKNYIKGVKKVNNTVTKATGGSLPPRRPANGQPSRKHADPGALPRPTNK